MSFERKGSGVIDASRASHDGANTFAKGGDGSSLSRIEVGVKLDAEKRSRSGGSNVNLNIAWPSDSPSHRAGSSHSDARKRSLARLCGRNMVDFAR